jgi:hypothetical protein
VHLLCGRAAGFLLLSYFLLPNNFKVARRLPSQVLCFADLSTRARSLRENKIFG